jgi:hypothetical protein
LQVAVLERVVEARVEEGFGFRLFGAEVLAFGVGRQILIVEVEEPEGADVSDGVGVDFTAEGADDRTSRAPG